MRPRSFVVETHACAARLERELQAVLVRVEIVGPSTSAAGTWRKHTTESSGSAGTTSKPGGLAAPPARYAARSSLCSISRREALGAEVLPREPELQRAEPARALDRVLEPVERRVLRPRVPVVLGHPVERLLQVLAAPHEQRADVVGLEEPLVRIDRDAVGALEVRHAAGVRAESRAAPP